MRRDAENSTRRRSAPAWAFGVAAFAVTAAAALAPMGCSSTGGAHPRVTETAFPTSTPYETHTITSTATATSTTTLTHNPTPIILSITVDCWNGGGCTVCGNVAYACYGPGSSACAFTDPAPGGYQVRRAVVTIFGLACTAGMYVQSDINGYLIGNPTYPPTNCSCGQCTTMAMDTTYLGGPIPGYVAGGTNVLTHYASASSLCHSYSTVTVYCY